MDFFSGNFSFYIIIVLFLNTGNVEGRYHFHKDQGEFPAYAPNDSPVFAPIPGSPVHDSPVLQSPSYPPTVSSDPVSSPLPEDSDNSTSNCVFDVTSFGAVGDGTTDDTAAFVSAWKAACAAESAVVFAPSGYTFMITSTVFYGPCKPGLVFLVRISTYYMYPLAVLFSTVILLKNSILLLLRWMEF